jgi:hypothetical protein
LVRASMPAFVPTTLRSGGVGTNSFACCREAVSPMLSDGSPTFKEHFPQRVPERRSPLDSRPYAPMSPRSKSFTGPTNNSIGSVVMTTRLPLAIITRRVDLPDGRRWNARVGVNSEIVDVVLPQRARVAAIGLHSFGGSLGLPGVMRSAQVARYAGSAAPNGRKRTGLPRCM